MGAHERDFDPALPVLAERECGTVDLTGGRGPTGSWTVGVCRSGCGTLLTDGVDHPFGPGDVVVVSRHADVVAQNAGTATWDLVHLDPAILPDDLAAGPDGWGDPGDVVVSEADAGRLREIVAEVAGELEERRHGYRPCVRALLAEFFVKLRRSSDTRPVPVRVGGSASGRRLIQPALDRIERAYGEDLSTPALAALCHLTEDSFRRDFRDVTGMSPREYWTRLRLRRAATALSTNDEPVIAVAQAAGFTSLSSFHRLFLAEYGIPPVVWRSATRADRPAPLRRGAATWGRLTRRGIVAVESHGRTIQKLAEAYREASGYKNVDAELVPGSYYRVWDRITERRTAGSPPDLAFLSPVVISGMIRRGELTDLRPHLDDFRIDLGSFLPQSLQQFEDGEHLWAIPAVIEPHLLYYNRELFRRAAVDEPSDDWDEPWTFAQWRDASERIAALGHGVRGHRLRAQRGRHSSVPLVERYRPLERRPAAYARRRVAHRRDL